MRHSTAEYCEAAEARIRALEEELEACHAERDEYEQALRLSEGLRVGEEPKGQPGSYLAWIQEQKEMKAQLARLQPVVEAARAILDGVQGTMDMVAARERLRQALEAADARRSEAFRVPEE